MSHPFAEITFTPAVKALQEKYGSRAQYARMQARGGLAPMLGPRESEFLAGADSFYLATVGETGWPYVQHRGGPAGFLKVRSEAQLAFADFRGNLQYVSAGNVAHDDRASLFVMDYVNRERLKFLGHLRFVDVQDADPGLVAAVTLPGYRAKVERVATFDVAAFEWNCPQHITPRFTLAQVDATTRRLRERITELEGEIQALRES
ncbi:MAG TPA: pyridoxamine 5'-phosphate oxidase family protein [Casimicrobiaceae bacterium]